MSISFELLSALTESLGSTKAITTLYELIREKFARASPTANLRNGRPLDRRALRAKNIDNAELQKMLQLLLAEEVKILPSEHSTSLTLDVVDATYYNLNGIRQERLRQARSTFNAALVLTVIGVLIVFAGVALIFTDKLSAGVITTAAGGITQIVSALLFRFNKESNDRLDEIGKDLHTLDKARLAMQYIEQISAGESKDKAISALVKDLQMSKQHSKR